MIVKSLIDSKTQEISLYDYNGKKIAITTERRAYIHLAGGDSRHVVLVENLNCSGHLQFAWWDSCLLLWALLINLILQDKHPFLS